MQANKHEAAYRRLVPLLSCNRVKAKFSWKNWKNLGSIHYLGFVQQPLGFSEIMENTASLRMAKIPTRGIKFNATGYLCSMYRQNIALKKDYKRAHLTWNG